jgi:clan AA aspartic protease (TIGR02281 family)
MSPTLRYSVIAVMLLSTTALGIIAYHAMNPPPPPAPPPAPVVETPPVVVQPPVVELPPPAPWVCPYDLVQSMQVQDALAVKPCSLHGATHLVASTKAHSQEVDASKTTITVSSAGSTREFSTNRTKIERVEQTPEEWAAMVAAYEAYPTNPAKREAYIARMLKKGTPDLDDIPDGPPPGPGKIVKAGSITIPAEENGHFFPKVTINGMPIRMMADTGAYDVALNEVDVRKLGLDPKALPKARECIHSTANGTKSGTCFVLPEITVEGIVLRDVPASCCVTGNNLLGLSALKRFNVSFTKGWMVLSLLD